MDIENLVLSSANTISELSKLKEKLKRLPKEYLPFPQLADNAKIGVMDFGSSNETRIFLSPMISYVYDGEINFPNGATNCTAQYSLSSDPKSVVPGSTFSFEGNKYIIHRTPVKHNNP